MEKIDLKRILMELGNKLVTEKKYFPASVISDDSDTNYTTKPIDNFVKWLNKNPDAIEILEEMGITWRMR